MSIILNIIKLDGSVLKISTMELPLAVSCYHLINIGSIILQKINLFFFSVRWRISCLDQQ